MTIAIQPLNLADLYARAETINTMREQRDAIAEYKRAQTEQVRQQQMMEGHKIVQDVARQLWRRLERIDDAGQRQAELDRLWPMVREHLSGTPAAPLLNANGDHPTWENVQLAAGMGATDEKWYGGVTVDDQGNAWLNSDRGNVRQANLGGQKVFKPPLTIDQGAGGTSIASPYNPTSPTGAYPKVPNYERGYRPPVQSPPPPVSYGRGQREAPMDAGFRIDPNMSDEAIGQAVRDYLTSGAAPAQGAPAMAAPSRIPPLPPPVRQPPMNGVSDPGYARNEGDIAAAQESAKNPILAQRERAKADIDIATDAAKRANENFAKVEGANMDRARRAEQIMGLIGMPGSDTAERLDSTVKASTGSTLGNVVDQAIGGITGQSTPGSLKIGELEMIAAQLLQNVPRFEGPQSNIDVQNYREAAADIANASTPVDKRIARLRQLRELMFGYMSGQRGRIVEASPEVGGGAIQAEPVEQRQSGQGYAWEDIRNPNLKPGDRIPTPDGKVLVVTRMVNGKPRFEERSK